MKEKKNRIGYHGIFTMIVILTAMLIPFGIVPFLMVCTLLWMVVRSIAVLRGKETMRKKYYKTDLFVVIFFAYEILHMFCQILWADEKTGIDYNDNLLFITLALLYFLCIEAKVFYHVYLDGIVYGGLIVMGMFLYGYLCDTSVAFLIGDMFGDSVQAASYLLLISMVSVLQYCRCHNGMQRWFYGASAGIGFFLLLVNHNRVSLWLMILFLLMVPIYIRPTAELVKRDMQMFLLYALLLCNMSLLSNYTDLLLVEISYDPEQSVYLELILALGALFFFHYWNRIPEGVPLDRVVLRRLYRKYQFVAVFMTCLLVFILFESYGWSALTGDKGMEFLGKLAMPLCDEIAKGRSFLHVYVEKQGLLVLIGLLLILISVVIRMRKNIGWDKPITTGLYLIAIFGIMQCFIWNPSVKVLPVYLILAVYAMNYQEERSRFAGVKIKDYEQLERQMRKKGKGWEIR